MPMNTRSTQQANSRQHLARNNAMTIRESFVDRHVGPSPEEIDQMLRGQGAGDLEEFLRIVVPDSIRIEKPPAFGDLEEAKNTAGSMEEHEILETLGRIMAKNKRAKPMLGLGYHGCHLPSPIKRLVLESPSWYTSYTPYQAEISQGRLEMLLLFQTMVASLCGLDMANASLLDEATAAAEAMTLLHRAHKGDEKSFLVDADTHPQTIDVLRTRAEPQGISIDVRDVNDNFQGNGAFGALLSHPGSSGRVLDHTRLISSLAEAGVLTAACTDLLACTIIKPPGQMGASVVVGSAQRLGMPMGMGGPHAGFMAFKEDLVRKAPGRIVGISRDTKGRPALRLALQTREQHIRRDKATSNICTSQALPAMVAAAYAIYHGPFGLRVIAKRTHEMACVIVDAAKKAGLAVAHDSFFDTVKITHEQPAKVVEKAAAKGILLRSDGTHVCVSCDETTTPSDIKKVLGAFGIGDDDSGKKKPAMHLDGSFLRDDDILTQPVFSRHHSEHSFIRFLRRMADRDIALDRSMIPLGSCTMKLNAATEMEALTDPDWCDFHPFGPIELMEGFKVVVDDLSSMLTLATGFDAISLQPNAGAQGEYAGLLAIHGYQKAVGDGKRDICLVPDSAHGTNPASAVMAGMRVVSVAIDGTGEIDLSDLKAKASEHKDSLAALMITYPSTCGTYGTTIREICWTIHENGGQVYMDGANLNAMVGVVLPADLGVDVMHINLHKTFCIPHGGGGPGMGPIVCKAHLEPHLPGHRFAQWGKSNKRGAISSAPYGSGALLVISWAYMRMLGPEGLRKATAVAVLAANHMLDKLRDAYPVAFEGEGGKVAHEFVLDMRSYKKQASVTVEDIAKRLIDFGFHAPTVSFPLPGAMMIEPTESEPLAEMERFCDAMLRIKKEIEMIESGKWQRDDNPLVNAPHVAQDLIDEEGSLPYKASEAAYPLDWVRQGKFWPAVSRIDQVHGDRNLRCVLGPAEDLAPGSS